MLYSRDRIKDKRLCSDCCSWRLGLAVSFSVSCFLGLGLLLLFLLPVVIYPKGEWYDGHVYTSMDCDKGMDILSEILLSTLHVFIASKLSACAGLLLLSKWD